MLQIHLLGRCSGWEQAVEVLSLNGGADAAREREAAR